MPTFNTAAEKVNNNRPEYQITAYGRRLLNPTTMQHKLNKFKFDIDHPDWYLFDESKRTIRARLLEIAECGMEEVGVAEFGYKGVMSGLYIEKVWSYSDEDFKSYMGWAKDLISKKHTCTNFTTSRRGCFMVCTDCGKVL